MGCTVPRKAKPFLHQGSYYTTAGGKWRKLCSEAEGIDAAYRLLGEPAEAPFPTVADAAAAYVAHCETYYRLPGGRVSSEPRGVALALGYFVRAAAGLTTAQLSKEHLKAARELMVSGRDGSAGCSRKTVNQHVGRVKRAVRWWCDGGRIPDATAAALLSLSPLPAFRSGAKEHEPVEAVEWERVEAALGRLAEPWRSIVRLQWYTGLRPGEACGLLVEQVDAAGKRLNFGLNHKTGYRGRAKSIPVGAHAVEVLAPWLRSAELNPRPAVFVTTWTGGAGLPRPAQPGSYAHAVARACEAACVAPWHPNQIRHSFATRVRAALGLEAAQHALGHANADVTQLYAERDGELARKAADLCG
jgi:integrase